MFKWRLIVYILIIFSCSCTVFHEKQKTIDENRIKMKALQDFSIFFNAVKLTVSFVELFKY